MEKLTQLDETWRLFPHTFAEYASGGKWKPYPYLKVISREIVGAVRKGNGRIIVEKPPRSGKSQLISYWTPVWYLVLELVPPSECDSLKLRGRFCGAMGAARAQ